MDAAEKREQNQAGYRRLKDMINATYQQGQFVALDEGTIVADAPTLEELIALLEQLGKNPKECLAVQAGVDYPEYLVILLQGDK